MAQDRPRNYFWESLEFAKLHRYRIVTVQERLDKSKPHAADNLVNAYVVYTIPPGGGRGQRCGRRRDPVELLKLLERLAR